MDDFCRTSLSKLLFILIHVDVQIDGNDLIFNRTSLVQGFPRMPSYFRICIGACGKVVEWSGRNVYMKKYFTVRERELLPNQAKRDKEKEIGISI